MLSAAGGKCGKHFFVVRIPMHYRQLQSYGCRRAKLGKQSLFCRKSVLQRPAATTLCCDSFGLPVASDEICLSRSLLNRRRARHGQNKETPAFAPGVLGQHVLSALI
jgi:hypothetical protein